MVNMFLPTKRMFCILFGGVLVCSYNRDWEAVAESPFLDLNHITGVTYGSPAACASSEAPLSLANDAQDEFDDECPGPSQKFRPSPNFCRARRTDWEDDFSYSFELDIRGYFESLPRTLIELLHGFAIWILSGEFILTLFTISKFLWLLLNPDIWAVGNRFPTLPITGTEPIDSALGTIYWLATALIHTWFWCVFFKVLRSTFKAYRYSAATKVPCYFNLWGLTSNPGVFRIRGFTNIIAASPRPTVWWSYEGEGEMRQLYRFRLINGETHKQLVTKGEPVFSNDGDITDVTDAEYEASISIIESGPSGECKVTGSTPKRVTKVNSKILPPNLATFTVVTPGGGNGPDEAYNHSLVNCSESCWLMTNHQRVNVKRGGLKDMSDRGCVPFVGKPHLNASDNFRDAQSASGVGGSGSRTHPLAVLAARTGCVGLLSLIADAGDSLDHIIARLCDEDKRSLKRELETIESWGLTLDSYIISVPGGSTRKGAESVADHLVNLLALKPAGVVNGRRQFVADKAKISKLHSLIGVATGRVRFKKCPVEGATGRIYYYTNDDEGNLVLHYAEGPINCKHPSMKGSDLAAFAATTVEGSSAGCVYNADSLNANVGNLQWIAYGTHNGAYDKTRELNGFTTVAWSSCFLSAASANAPDDVDITVSLEHTASPIASFTNELGKTLKAFFDESPIETLSSAPARVPLRAPDLDDASNSNGESVNQEHGYEGNKDEDDARRVGITLRRTKSDNRDFNADRQNAVQTDEERAKHEAAVQLAAEHEAEQAGAGGFAQKSLAPAVRKTMTDMRNYRPASGKPNWADELSDGECFSFFTAVVRRIAAAKEEQPDTLTAISECSESDASSNISTEVQPDEPVQEAPAPTESSEEVCSETPGSSSHGESVFCSRWLLDTINDRFAEFYSKVDHSVSERFDTLSDKIETTVSDVTQRVDALQASVGAADKVSESIDQRLGNLQNILDEVKQEHEAVGESVPVPIQGFQEAGAPSEALNATETSSASSVKDTGVEVVKTFTNGTPSVSTKQELSSPPKQKVNPPLPLTEEQKREKKRLKRLAQKAAQKEKPPLSEEQKSAADHQNRIKQRALTGVARAKKGLAAALLNDNLFSAQEKEIVQNVLALVDLKGTNSSAASPKQQKQE